MPYFTDPNLQKDQEDQQSQASGAAPVTLTPGNATGNANASGSGSSGINSAGTSSAHPFSTGSNFVNLDKYLGANQPSQFGDQLAGKVGQTIQNAQNNQQLGGQQFVNDVQNQNQTPTANQVSTALNDPENANAKQFQDWMNQTYQGPHSLAEDQSAYNQYWNGTDQAQTNANLLGTEPGRFTLLDNYFGRPQYSAGEKSLDNLLLQNSGIGQETKDLLNQAAQLTSQGQQNANQISNTALTNATTSVNQSNANVNNAYNQAVTAAENAISNRAGQETAQRTGQEKDLEQAIQNGQLSQSQFDQLGIAPGSSLYGLNIANYLNQTPVTNEQAATDEQRANLNALAQLGNQAQTFLQAPQAYTPGQLINQSQFQNDYAAAQTAAQALQDQFTQAKMLSALNSNPNNPVPQTLPGTDTAQNIAYLESLITPPKTNGVQRSDSGLRPMPTTQNNQDLLNQWTERAKDIQPIIDAYNQYQALYGTPLQLNTGQLPLSITGNTVPSFIKQRQ